MKKTLLTLAGSAMLVSVLTLSAANLSPKDLDKGRSQRRSLFAELTKKEKEEMTEAVAEDLSDILQKDKEELKKKMVTGEDIETIITDSGMTIDEALSLAKERHHALLVQELKQKVSLGVISEESAEAILKKMDTNKW